MKNEKCILLFSGGRDSTLSSVLLSKQFEYIHLITIKSVHLKGLENVYTRLKILQPFLQEKCSWELYRKIENIPLKRLKITTCLPCHAYYIALLQCLARSQNIKNVSLGYVGYQNCWEEQSPYAKKSLREYLANKGINLILPVEDIQTKDDMKQALKDLGLPEEASEQKCLKSSFNIPLNPSEIEEQVDAWILSIEQIYKIIQEKYTSTLIDTLKL